jgi:predicted nucleic acid-binding protein
MSNRLGGLMIGPYDVQIAAIAVANNCTLVTHNTAKKISKSFVLRSAPPAR